MSFGIRKEALDISKLAVSMDILLSITSRLVIELMTRSPFTRAYASSSRSANPASYRIIFFPEVYISVNLDIESRRNITQRSLTPIGLTLMLCSAWKRSRRYDSSHIIFSLNMASRYRLTGLLQLWLAEPGLSGLCGGRRIR